ncbi:winged helix-turn-helix transcriptional regulator [Cetobacterium sp. 8H]|uniref:carbohydrate kinase n=1 Tax=Cetobacterium sp. 8H TaxID=2759681 RepID=UPI00163CF372|nr:carbohydrate kinase [Cetobacterium sp. 8H]MBC2851152.1 winged helix-turn-helix transcriptional regulator [Cetobacterium sp. 8H]
MTNREQEILKWIEENPFISQAELAEKADIARSSVAVHISNLIKKGKIIGKGYIIQKKSFISVIGGTNIDISATSYSPLKDYDSNPGKVNTSFGGVARNIADNLSRLNQDVELLTVLGDDFNSDEIKRNCKTLGIGISNALTMPNSATSTYISILNDNKDMKIAISAMDLYENLTIEYIKSKKDIIEESKLCIIDTNIPKETIDFIVNNFNIPIFLDCVSTTKALKIVDIIGKFHTIKPNKLEAEAISGIKITDSASLQKCAEFFINKGVKQVFISLGEKGVFFSNGKIYSQHQSFKTSILNTTGAGDAFMAGIAYSYIEGLDILESCRNGIACATIAISSDKTISDNMNLENINIIKEENL